MSGVTGSRGAWALSIGDAKRGGNRADAHKVSPDGPLLKVCRIFVANTADWAGFADLTDS